jgi:hypothetical protein
VQWCETSLHRIHLIFSIHTTSNYLQNSSFRCLCRGHCVNKCMATKVQSSISHSNRSSGTSFPDPDIRINAAILYNLGQTVVYAIMALGIMRLKLFLTPHLCITVALLTKDKVLIKYYPPKLRRQVKPTFLITMQWDFMKFNFPNRSYFFLCCFFHGEDRKFEFSFELSKMYNKIPNGTSFQGQL